MEKKPKKNLDKNVADLPWWAVPLAIILAAILLAFAAAFWWPVSLEVWNYWMA